MTIKELLSGIFHSQYIARIPFPTSKSFQDKTVIVTGSNTGIGKEAVKHFVRLGAAQVILACRNLEKGDQAKADIVKSHPRASTVIDVWHLDLASFDNVKTFAKRVISDLPRLDVLVESAAISTFKYSLLENNEANITTNVISTYLLALLLLPKLKQTAEEFSSSDPPREPNVLKPHLVIVTSDIHYQFNDLVERSHPRIFTALSDLQVCNMNNQYATSKLLQILIARHIVKQYLTPVSSYHPVVFNLVTPGFCDTDITKELGGPFTVKFVKFLLNARSAEVGGRTLVNASCAGSESMGQFLMDCEIREPSEFVSSESGAEVGARLWKELSEILERISPGILNALES